MVKNKETLSITEKIINKLNDTYGEGSVMKFTDDTISNVKLIPTKFPSLNKILGGGIPEGRIIEIFGPESSGKSTLALHFTAAIQKAGYEVAYVDAEHALDLKYASNLGVDRKMFYISQPGSGEEALDIVEFLLDTDIKLIVVDSVSALTPQAEISGEMGDSHMGLQARLMSQAMRKLTSKISKKKTIIIFINQLRSKIGVMYGNPETTSGGNALKFYASLRIDTRRKDKIKNGDEILGEKVKVKIVKNKIAPPFQETTLTLIYQQGFIAEADILDEAIEKEIIKKAGSWFSYGETKLGQGYFNVLDILLDNPELTEEIKTSIENH